MMNKRDAVRQITEMTEQIYQDITDEIRNREETEDTSPVKGMSNVCIVRLSALEKGFCLSPEYYIRDAQTKAMLDYLNPVRNDVFALTERIREMRDRKAAFPQNQSRKVSLNPSSVAALEKILDGLQ